MLERGRQRTHGAKGVKDHWYCLVRGHARLADHASRNVAILIHTTLGNGYLGSLIDEERSKMWYLVWIAKSWEPSSFWTKVAPEAFWLRARLPGRHAKRHSQPILGYGHGLWLLVPHGMVGWSCGCWRTVSAPACGGRHKLFSGQCPGTQLARCPKGPVYHRSALVLGPRPQVRRDYPLSLSI